MIETPATATPAAVAPSRFVRAVISPLTKALNPRMVKKAGRPGFQGAAQIHHVGRRTGRAYVTPVGARLTGEVFVIPLTFGNQSDWVRNVRAAGGCTIRLDGADYRAVGPEFTDTAQARELVRSVYGPGMRAAFRMLGIRQFMLLRLAGR
ncbi:MAG TPA: nitroreductase family deazaflavin-dependent oxidoreductase [Streptosporangiaceae bacterium]|jgi:deazaflavin-dependent oxidoreductase (nitroreductase family)